MFDLSWYNTLIMPPFTPPYWVFMPVWIFLYLSMLIAVLIYAAKPSIQDKSWGIILFFSQLIVNLCWAPVFFNFHNIAFALVIIIVLDILVFWTMKEFFIVSKSSSRTLIPYFIWILYATYLNAGVYMLN